MTTYFQFAPTIQGPFTFQPTLDGAVYTVIITWSVFGQRWYANCYDGNNNLVFARAVVSSEDKISTASITWDAITQTATATTSVPHDVPVGQLAQMTLIGVTPPAYNGIWTMTAESPTSLRWPLSPDPGGDATVQGQVGRDVSLSDGYFSSTLVYRGSTGRFEVSP